MIQDMQVKSNMSVENILKNLSEDDILDLIEEGQLEKFCNILTLDIYALENTSSKYLA
jgi:uncharacterized protein YuzB (UPF0349 family)